MSYLQKKTYVCTSELFGSFLDKLEISSSTLDSIAYRSKEIIKPLNGKYWGKSLDGISNRRFVGSYGRGTEINISDIDLLFVSPIRLKKQYEDRLWNGQSDFLQDIKNVIKVRYPRTDMRGDGQVVVINFSDGMRFELLPVFQYFDEGEGLFYYTYPDTKDGGYWRRTKPNHEIRAVNHYNEKYNGNLVALAKMTRAWKEHCKVPIGGLLIDTLAAKFLSDWAYNKKGLVYYDYMARDFFHFLSRLPTNNYWYALGSNQQIYSKGLFQAKAKKAAKLAEGAIEAYRKEYYYSCAETWRKIYGTKFPSYYSFLY